MNWQTPKENWHPSDPEGVAGDDLNRIEGNTQFLAEVSAIEDYDGRRYRTITINGQQWTADNWASAKYNDGTGVPLVTDQTAWEAATTPAYCLYDNYVSQYGALYNWHVVDPGNAKTLAPEGWRVPTLFDITTLNNYLIAQGYRYDRTTTPVDVKTGKSWASVHGWTDYTSGFGPITPGEGLERNNNSGVSIYPGGLRQTLFDSIQNQGFIWTQSVSGSDPYHATVQYNGTDLTTAATASSKYMGMSVKFVREI